MGTTTVSAAAERATELRKRINELGKRKRQAEAARDEQSDALAREVSRRVRIIECLTTAGSDAKKLHKELDAIDAGLIETERLGESYALTVKKIDGEIAALAQELNQVESVIQAEERATALEAFRVKYQLAVRRASESLDNARADLAALTILETNAITSAISDAEGLNINRICEPIFAEFAFQQANLDRRGWRLFPGTRNLQFLIRPMTRG